MDDNIYLKLAKARVEVQKRCTKKSGHNKFADFDYFELKDFLSQATEELLKVGLIALFNLKKDFNEQLTETEKAILTITDGEKEIIFETPSADVVVKGANEIQNLGSKHTYLKRYLYMNALELSENDGVDATIAKDKKEQTDSKSIKATEKQIELIRELYDEDNINKMIAFYKVEHLEDLSVQQASQAIAKKKGQTKNGTN